MDIDGQTLSVVITQLRESLTGTGFINVTSQCVYLSALELYMLYGLFRARSPEVVLFSHWRFYLGVIVMASITCSYWQLILWLRGEGWTRYILFCILGYCGGGYLGHVQQVFLFAINSMGSKPITKDLTRPKLAGNDCHYSVIRRFAVFIFLWFLLIPGAILTSPLNDLMQCICLLPWGIAALKNIGRTGLWWFPNM